MAQGAFSVSMIPPKSKEQERLKNVIGYEAPKAKVVFTMRSGMSFGELSLLYQAPRSATVTSDGKGMLW